MPTHWFIKPDNGLVGPFKHIPRPRLSFLPPFKNGRDFVNLHLFQPLSFFLLTREKLICLQEYARSIYLYVLLLQSAILKCFSSDKCVNDAEKRPHRRRGNERQARKEKVVQYSFKVELSRISLLSSIGRLHDTSVFTWLILSIQTVKDTYSSIIGGGTIHTKRWKSQW